MSNKALYILLIMTLLSAQADLQAANGQDFSDQPSPAAGFYTLESISTPNEAKIINMETKSALAAPQLSCFTTFWVQDQTNSWGDASWVCDNCVFRAPVCSAFQNDFPHRITVSLELGGTRMHVVSWAPWFTAQAGPIWYSCQAFMCR